MIGHVYRRHHAHQVSNILRFKLLSATCHVISLEHEKVPVNGILQIAVGHIKIFVSIVVKIGKQRGPAPVGGSNAGQSANFTERAVAVVELQRITHVLPVKTHAHKRLKSFLTRWDKHRLLPLAVLWQHVQHHHIGMPIIVDVRHIDAHRRIGGMPRPRTKLIRERAILVVDVEEIGRGVVVADVHIHPPITIKIGDAGAQTVAPGRTQNAGLQRHVFKVIAVVAIKTHAINVVLFEKRLQVVFVG